MNHMTIYALTVAREREREFVHQAQLSELRAGQRARPSQTRRRLALALAALSRGSASAVRRLDDCVADDLGRSFSAAE
jgi:hypothetical protein